MKTFTLNDKLCARARPGQFVMLWVPGVDEIPLSVLEAEKNKFSVAVRIVGEATRTLHSMKVGDILGVRGPFGSSFTEAIGKVLMVAGGTGTAPLLFLAGKIAANTERLTFVVGAKTKDELLFIKEVKSLCNQHGVIATTEDGSFGIKCLATEPLETLLKAQKFDMVYTCGPELMMRKVFDLSEKLGFPMEASLERLMRCGIGLCGSCVIGKYRVCKEGPVFNKSQLAEVKDIFGISRLDFDGKRIPI